MKGEIVRVVRVDLVVVPDLVVPYARKGHLENGHDQEDISVHIYLGDLNLEIFVELDGQNDDKNDLAHVNGMSHTMHRHLVVEESYHVDASLVFPDDMVHRMDVERSHVTGDDYVRGRPVRPGPWYSADDILYS